MRGLEAVGVSCPFVYDVIYALAASEGRERVLFGSSAPLAHDAFGRSLVGDVFPELWFEVPLLGEPWFDLQSPFPLEFQFELMPDGTTGGTLGASVRAGSCATL